MGKLVLFALFAYVKDTDSTVRQSTAQDLTIQKFDMVQRTSRFNSLALWVRCWSCGNCKPVPLEEMLAITSKQNMTSTYNRLVSTVFIA